MDREMFLQAYRSVENTLRNKYHMSYWDFESNVAGADMRPKLQLCRIMRNYMSHEKDGSTFVLPSRGQILFLQNLNACLVNFR